MTVTEEEHISTEQQGKYNYSIFVRESGAHWEWSVERMRDVAYEIVPVTAIADGRSTNREEAIKAAQRARQKAMADNRNLD